MFKNIKTYGLYFLILVYVSGAIGFYFYPEFFKPFTPVTLLLTFCVFISFQDYRNPEYRISVITLSILTFTIEVIGVNTGLIFGDYHYGNSLGPKMFQVPLVISINWALLINCGVLIAERLSHIPVLLAVASALIVTLYDICLEVVAPIMDMWYFEKQAAGIQNFVAWFIISFLASYILQKHLKKGSWKLALFLIILQLSVFGSVYLKQLCNS